MKHIEGSKINFVKIIQKNSSTLTTTENGGREGPPPENREEYEESSSESEEESEKENKKPPVIEIQPVKKYSDAHDKSAKNMQKIFRGNKARRETEQMKKKLQNPLAPPPPPPPVKPNLLAQINGTQLKSKNKQKPLAPRSQEKPNLVKQIGEIKLKKTEEQKEVQNEEQKVFTKPKETKPLTIMDSVMQKLDSRRRHIKKDDNDADDEGGWDSDAPIKSPTKSTTKTTTKPPPESKQEDFEHPEIVIKPEKKIQKVFNKKARKQPDKIPPKNDTLEIPHTLIPPLPPPPDEGKSQDEINEEIRKKRVSFFENKNQESEETKNEINKLSEGVKLAEELLRSLYMDINSANATGQSYKKSDKIRDTDLKLYKELVDKYKLLDIKQIRAKTLSYKNVMERLENSKVLAATMTLLEEKRKEDEEQKKEKEKEKNTRFPSRGRADVRTLGGGEGEQTVLTSDTNRSKTPSKRLK